MSFKPRDNATVAVNVANAFMPSVLDTSTSSTTSLTIKRNSSANTNAIVLQNETLGGRVGITYRDENDNDIARAQAHNGDDPGSSTSQYVIYTRRATARLDGNMMEARFLIESETDWGVASVYAATLQVNTHDTDGNLNETQTGFKAYRSPGDVGNETTELLRARTSSVGSNYFYRDLAAADTAGPLVRIINDNASDDQVAVRVTQDCSQAALDVENTTTGPAVYVRQGYMDLAEQTDPTGPAADRLRLYAKDQGTGKTILSTRTGSGVEHLYGSIVGSATWDPGSIADGAMTSTTVTVTGAAAGDPVEVGFSIAVPAGAILQGNVTSANTVTVTLFNKTGGALDLASGTLRAKVSKVV